MATVVRGDRASFGGALSPAQTSPLRLGALPARTGTTVLNVNANGDVTVGALAAADIPAVFTRRDVNEAISGAWTWSTTLAFAAGGTLAPPQAATRSIGTRLIVEPVAASTEYALGRDTDTLWTSVPAGKVMRWYTGNVSRLRLDADGTFNVENGTGLLQLLSDSGYGGIATYGDLNLLAGGTGALQLRSGPSATSGLILPVAGYRENLGQINRKFLSLHAAELWVETLVAQQTLATIGGRILVGPTTTLTRDCAPADTTIYVKHNSFKLYVAGVEYGSKVIFESAGKFEIMEVTSTSVPTATAQGDYAYTVNRAKAGTASQWYAGDACLDTGKVTGGVPGAFLDLYSVQGVNAGSSAGPTIVGNLRIGGAATAFEERWAVGNLKGIFNNGGADVFGAAFGPPTSMHLQIDATNGIRMLGSGNAVTYGEWRPDGTVRFGYTNAGNLSFTPADGQVHIQWNGVDMLRLTGGTLYLDTGLMVGSTPGTTGVVRSAFASAWNSGHGFFFDANPTTGIAHALIGNSAGRRVQWDGASLKVISDGFTIDEFGITLGQATSGSPDPSKQVKFGSTGLYLWDTSTGGGQGLIARQSGILHIEASNTTSIVRMQSGGASIDRVSLALQSIFGGPSQMVLDGTAGGGPYPRFVPSVHAQMDLGRTDLYWRTLYTAGIKAISYVHIGTVSVGYWLELAADSAGKPTSSTWVIVSDRRAKTDVRPVDCEAALATVRRVPMIRARTTGDLGTEKDAEVIGVVAQDVRDLLPLSVQERNGVLTWNAHELLMLNVAAVQALAARLDALDGKDQR